MLNNLEIETVKQIFKSDNYKLSLRKGMAFLSKKKIIKNKEINIIISIIDYSIDVPIICKGDVDHVIEIKKLFYK